MFYMINKNDVQDLKKKKTVELAENKGMKKLAVISMKANINTFSKRTNLKEENK